MAEGAGAAPDCIFCAISAGEAPASIVDADESVLAFIARVMRVSVRLSPPVCRRSVQTVRSKVMRARRHLRGPRGPLTLSP